ncbi:MAG: protein-glutamate O-methyltransferase CheR [Proteobacteria bacterium]|nr:protein-glutamate O-methyltransferase CheR [Pseudomonadota bacterium]
MPPVPDNTTAAVDCEPLEVELVLDGIYRRYGCDFRSYARSLVTRRLRERAAADGLHHVSDLLPRLLHDRNCLARLLLDLSITVTHMFRQVHAFAALRTVIVPHLQTYPFFKVWHAGCATGEEAYSTAIVLHEEGVLDRARIYATDFNANALRTAQPGIYSLKAMHACEEDYRRSGGKRRLADYYRAKYKSARLHPLLRERITFANHNLVTDGVFGEMQLVMCRNVLTYFNSTLQDHVLTLFRDSLSLRGFSVWATQKA